MEVQAYLNIKRLDLISSSYNGRNDQSGPKRVKSAGLGAVRPLLATYFSP
jgi:hypothetical protein